MAYTTGSVTAFTDFIEALKSYLTSNSWSVLKDAENPRELYFNNPDQDLIIGFKVSTDNSTYYNLLFNICDSYDSSKSFYQQTNSIPNYPDNIVASNFTAPLITLHNNAINYWFFLNNRRLIIVARCGTSYISGYIGKFLPYGTNEQYPKPHFAGGNGVDAKQLLSNTQSSNAAFIYNVTNNPARSVMRNTNGDWINFNFTYSTASMFPTQNSLADLNLNTDGSYSLYPICLISDQGWAGELEGVSACSGVNNNPEKELLSTPASIAFNNIFRTSTADFFAITKN